MRVIPFPRRGDVQDDALVAELEAALSGESTGPVAVSWCELRADVRALAPPMSPELERELWARVEQASAPRPRRATIRPRPRAVPARLSAWLASGLRARLLAVSGVVAIAAIVTVAIVAPWQGERIGGDMFKPDSAEVAGQSDIVPAGPVKATAHKHSSSVAAAVPGEAAAGGEAASGGAASGARVQQRGASITLAPKPAAVQSVADQVAQLAARDGGFVQSSHVSLQHGAPGEASLQLSLPGARLSTALAELARLAPARAESQALQDITDEYDADRTKLADAVAERQALLRALAKASAQGEIESLHARLELAAAAITHARGEYQAISRRGSNSAVEVTVLGDAHRSESSSTVSKGLRDAGDVLKVVLAVLVVALAVLVPLAIVLAALAVGRRAARRRLRERALS
jgi:hypothetical protein